MGSQSGQHVVFTITVLQHVYTRLIFQLCGSSGLTGYPRKNRSYHRTSTQVCTLQRGRRAGAGSTQAGCSAWGRLRSARHTCALYFLWPTAFDECALREMEQGAGYVERGALFALMRQVGPARRFVDNRPFRKLELGVYFDTVSP